MGFFLELNLVPLRLLAPGLREPCQAHEGGTDQHDAEEGEQRLGPRDGPGVPQPILHEDEHPNGNPRWEYEQPCQKEQAGVVTQPGFQPSAQSHGRRQSHQAQSPTPTSPSSGRNTAGERHWPETTVATRKSVRIPTARTTEGAATAMSSQVIPALPCPPAPAARARLGPGPLVPPTAAG